MDGEMVARVRPRGGCAGRPRRFSSLRVAFHLWVYMAGGRRLRHSVFRPSEARTTSTVSRMNTVGTVLLAVTATLVSQVFGGQHPCNAGSPDFQQCVRSNLQHLIPQLANGVPSIGAEPIEPLQGLPSVRHSSPTGVNVQMDDVSLSGLSTVIVTDMNVDLATNTIRIVSTFPAQLVATGTHTTDAVIMGIPLKGSGPFKVALNQPILDLTLSGTPTVGPDGQTYLQLSSSKAHLQAGSASADIQGLFSDFSPLERAANAFANSVANLAVEDARPSLEQWLAGIALQRAQAVFSTVPYDALFPGRTPAAVGLYRAFPTLGLGLGVPHALPLPLAALRYH